MDKNVREWFDAVPSDDLYLSTQTGVNFINPFNQKESE
jgi:hypothetical protein